MREALTKEKVLATHPMYVYSKDVSDICRPLNLLGINYFSHVKITDDKDFSALSLNPAFGEHYLRKEYFNADIHLAKAENIGKFVIWDAIEITNDSKQLYQDSVAFGVDHTLTIMDISSQEKNFYHFATNLRDRSINDEYLRHMDLLTNFISYFNNTVMQSKKLSKSYEMKVTVTDKAAFSIEESFDQVSKQRQKFLAEINKDNENFYSQILYRIKYLFGSVLTLREMDCMVHLVLGRTAKATAVELGISRRTVEEHLVNIKNKLKAESKNDLMKDVLARIYNL